MSGVTVPIVPVGWVGVSVRGVEVSWLYVAYWSRDKRRLILATLLSFDRA
jgi:hypothetical protein